MRKYSVTIDKWDIAHMEVAHTYAKLSSATRLKVGCVIVKDNRIISIGYNGMPSGWDNTCEYDLTDTSIDGRITIVGNKTKPEVMHAETNAIAKVAKSNESADGATLYVTHAPCLDCAKIIYQSGINKVVYHNDYRCTDGVEFLRKCSIEVHKYFIN
jgi:dCMP deaminase